MKKTLTLIASALMLLSCSGKKVPFTEMKNYFVNNTVEGSFQGVIDNQADFDRLFGEAALMGTDGRPTTVDFSKEFVIAVVCEPTEIATKLEAYSLEKASDGTLLFIYRKTTGERLGYTTHPCLLVKVPGNYFGSVSIESHR